MSEYEKDGLFMCYTCGIILGYLNKSVGRIYLENRISKQKNICRCRKCGAVQWGYRANASSSADNLKNTPF